MPIVRVNPKDLRHRDKEWDEEGKETEYGRKRNYWIERK